MYKIGDKVVYPHHGAGTIVKKESREVLGAKREYLTIKIQHNHMTVQVPSDECTEWLEEVLSTGNNGQKQTTSSKKKAVAASA